MTEISAKIVVHFLDGRLLKGISEDPFSGGETFHLKELVTNESVAVEIAELKGVFFVKSYQGDPSYQESYDEEVGDLDTKLSVRFRDGETIIGLSKGYSPDRTHFWLYPADPRANTEGILVNTLATEAVKVIRATDESGTS